MLAGTIHVGIAFFCADFNDILFVVARDV